MAMAELRCELHGKGIELNGTAEKGKGLEQPCNGITQTSGAMAKLRTAVNCKGSIQQGLAKEKHRTEKAWVR